MMISCVSIHRYSGTNGQLKFEEPYPYSKNKKEIHSFLPKNSHAGTVN